jgi:tetratricopeptide (TPR) repeat protein
MERLTLKGLWQAGFDSPLSRRPVANISFALNYYLGGYHLFGYHLVNIVIHLITGWLLFYWLNITLVLCSYHRRSAFWIAVVTATIWLVHPLQTQSVTYIVQRMNSLAALFYLLSLVLYARGRVVQRQQTDSTWKVYCLFGGSFLAGVLALGSKEIAATLPVFIFLYEWYFFQGLSVGWIRKHIWVIVAVFVVLGGIALIYLGDHPLGRILGGYGRRDFTLEQRLLTQLRVVMFYFSLLLFPHPSRLNLDHDFSLSHSLLDPVTTVVSLVFLANMLILAVVFARKERLLSFCVLWLLGNLVIESSVIGLELVFEHRMYLPSMLAILVVVILVHRYVGHRWAVIALVCAVTAVFSVWTYQRNRVWQDEITLLTDCIKKSPRKVRPYSALGIAYYKRGDMDNAKSYFIKSLSIEPNYARAHNNLGVVLAMEGDFDGAIMHFEAALKLVPDFLDATNNLKRALADKRKQVEGHIDDERKIGQQ